MWCDGKNALDVPNPYGANFDRAGQDLCGRFRSGERAHARSAWYGCCVDPSSGKGQLIAFLDCCGSHSWTFNNCSLWRTECDNWSQAKSWCITTVAGVTTGAGYELPAYNTEQYYCTVVINMNLPESCS